MISRFLFSRTTRALASRSFYQRPQLRPFSFYNKIKGVLEDTFADEVTLKKKEAEKKKEEAIKRKLEQERIDNLSEEERAAMEDAIPEAMKNQMIYTGQKKENIGFYEGLKKKVGESYKNSDFYKKLRESEEYEKDEEEAELYSETVSEAKENLKAQVEESGSKFVEVTREVSSQVTASKMKSVKQGLARMRQLDPSFDIFEFEDICKGMFLDVYAKWREDDLETLESMSEDEALGFFKASNLMRNEMEIEFLVKHLIQLETISLYSANIVKGEPVFSFIAIVFEVDALVKKEDHDEVIDGTKDKIVKSTYQFDVGRSMEPVDHLFGHNYILRGFKPVGKVAQVL